MFPIQITTSLCTCSSCGVVVLTWLCWGGFQMDHSDTPSKQMVRNTWSCWWKMHVSCQVCSMCYLLLLPFFLTSPNFVEERVNSPKFQNNKIVKKWEPQNWWCSSRWSSQLRIHGMVINKHKIETIEPEQMMTFRMTMRMAYHFLEITRQIRLILFVVELDSHLCGFRRLPGTAGKNLFIIASQRGLPVNTCIKRIQISIASRDSWHCFLKKIFWNYQLNRKSWATHYDSIITLLWTTSDQ